MLNIPQHSLHLMLVILTILVVGTLCYLWLSRRYPERDYLELKLRIRSWWWMVAIVFVVLQLPLNYTLFFSRFPQFHGTERVSLDCAHTNDRSPSDFLGLFVHSISVLLALHRLVRHVHYLYSSLCIPIPAYGDGADWRY